MLLCAYDLSVNASWHFAGDHYWEDPMLAVGHLTKIVIDDANDTFEVKIGKGKKTAITLEHGQLGTQAELLGQLQEKLQEVVAGAKGADKWRAVVQDAIWTWIDVQPSAPRSAPSSPRSIS